MKISIITVAYNSAATLPDTIESVLRQDYADIEYILVDGNSTDATPDMAERYRPALQQRVAFRYLREADDGLYDAMNKGLAMATGEVVGILNSDDFFASDTIISEIAAAFSADATLDAVYGDVRYVQPDDFARTVRYYSSAAFHRSRMRRGFMPAHPSFYCRRAVYEKYGTFDTSYRVAADFELLLRLIYVHGIRTHYLPKCFVTMRIGGLSNGSLKNRLRIMRDHRRALASHGISSNYLLLSTRYFSKIRELIAGRFGR